MSKVIPMVVTRKRLEGWSEAGRRGAPGFVWSKPCGSRRQIWGAPEGTALRVGHF